MGVYVYCVVPPEHEPPADLAGVDGAAVRKADIAAIACWLSDLPQRPEPTVTRIRQHNGVVEAAVSEQITPVPVRFGQWLGSDDQAGEELGKRAAEFEKSLRLFAGALEFGLRVLDPEQPKAHLMHPEPGITGRAYLTALSEQWRAREGNTEIRDLIHTEFASLVRAERFDESQGPQRMLSAAHLVARSNFDAYRQRARDLRERTPNLRFLSSGPWPPYSFAA